MGQTSQEYANGDDFDGELNFLFSPLMQQEPNSSLGCQQFPHLSISPSLPLNEHQNIFNKDCDDKKTVHQYIPPYLCPPIPPFLPLARPRGGTALFSDPAKTLTESTGVSDLIHLMKISPQLFWCYDQSQILIAYGPTRTTAQMFAQMFGCSSAATETQASEEYCPALRPARPNCWVGRLRERGRPAWVGECPGVFYA